MWGEGKNGGEDRAKRRKRRKRESGRGPRANGSEEEQQGPGSEKAVVDVFPLVLFFPDRPGSFLRPFFCELSPDASTSICAPPAYRPLLEQKPGRKGERASLFSVLFLLLNFAPT